MRSPGSKVRLHFPDSIFRLGPFVGSITAKLARGLEFQSCWSVFSETKPRRRIPPTQCITTWVSPGGVSSSLMVNAFKFGCDLCFRDAPGERELSKGFEVFSRRAHATMAKRRCDLRRDISGRRLQEDLIGDFPEIA
jgi:hypothetical protein